MSASASSKAKRTEGAIPLRPHAICSKEINRYAGEQIRRTRDDNGDCRCLHIKYPGMNKNNWFHWQNANGSIYYKNPDGSAYYHWPKRGYRWYTDPDSRDNVYQWSRERMDLVPAHSPLEVWRREHPGEYFFGEQYDDPYEQWMDPEESADDLGISGPPRQDTYTCTSIPMILAQMFHLVPCDLDCGEYGYHSPHNDPEADIEENEMQDAASDMEVGQFSRYDDYGFQDDDYLRDGDDSDYYL